MKITLIHDWLVTEGGAEKVFFEMWKLFPGKVHTLFYHKEKLTSFPFKRRDIQASFLQKLPFVWKYYRWLLPLFPFAIERFDLSSSDIILSSSHAVAKGVLKREDQLHICYCYTPMRYAWDLKENYLADLASWQRKLASPLLTRMQVWDYEASSRVDVFIADSYFVADRIRRNYQREAKVIYPPVFFDRFFIGKKKEEYYVTHARLVPYKRVDLLVEAFNLLPDKKLVVIGDGPERRNLEAMAKKNIDFLGFLEEADLTEVLSKAKAYVFAAEEDFGIAVVEAQAAGLPVIALGKGGALEIILDGITGLFFADAQVESLLSAIRLFEKKEDCFNPELIRQKAARFSLERFQKEMVQFLEEAQKVFYEDRHSCRRERNKALASI